MLYVAVYAEAQRRAEDSKELGAALAALFLNLIHFVRTVWGLAQLQAFVAWCKEAMECFAAMRGGSSGTSDEELEEWLMVNNTVVDNELGGTDATVKVSWRKVWEGLKKRELKPITWLETEAQELCTMRWASALLCGVDGKWVGVDFHWRSRGGETLASFYSSEMYSARRHLGQVTIDREEEGFTAPLYINEQKEEESADTGQVAAYGYNESKKFQVRDIESYSFEIESLRSSYPARKGHNREKAVAGVADSVIMAKRLGVEKLSKMRRYFERNRLPSNKIWHKAMQLFLEQCGETPKDDSPLRHMFHFLEAVPLLYQLRMVSLWDKCRNWRLLQASAHIDIDAQLSEDWRQEYLFEMETLPTNVFEYCRRRVLTGTRNVGFLGVSMETVRSFLGEWVLFAPDLVDWEPSIPTNSFEFSTSFRVTSSAGKDRKRIIWECQRGLQSKVAENSTVHVNMSSSAELIMLFILSMPLLRVAEEEVGEENRNSSNETGVVSGRGNSDSTVSRAHSSVNVSMMDYRVYSPLAPQDISVVARWNTETRRASLSLRYNGADVGFKWEEWVNASMGWMKGVYELEKERGNMENVEYGFRELDLRKPMVELSPLSWVERNRFAIDHEDKVMETGIMRVWTGWPAFDVRICKFEVEQWLNACSIDIDNIQLNVIGENPKVQRSIDRAEETIRKVREVIHLDMDDERSEEDNVMSLQ